MLVLICVGNDRVHTHTFLLSCHKSKSLTLKVITGCYVLTLSSALSSLLKLGTLPPFFYYELLILASIKIIQLTLSCMYILQ